MTAFQGTSEAVAHADWIRGLPDGWSYSRLKWTVASAKNGIWGDNADGGDDDIICARVADFDREKLLVDISDPTLQSVAMSQRVGRVLRRGDLLLEKSGGGEKQPVGAVVTYAHDKPAVCSNFVARLQIASGNHSRFLTYLHASLYYQRVNTRSIKQTTGIQNLDGGMYLDEVVAVPPLPTQRAIADFLDRKTAAIDALIEKKERLLELLAEKRAALIHRAVTKGLDPSVPMKDSGVPWIGEIPEHWEVMQLRRVLATLDQGWSPSALDRPKEDHEWGVLKLSAVRDGEYRPEFHKTLPDDLEPRPEFIPRVKDLLVSRANTPDMVGESCVVDQVDPRMMLCDLLYRLRLERKRAIPGFVDLFIRSASGKAFRKTDARGTSHSMVKLSQGHVRAWPLPLPPLHEQKAVVAATRAASSSNRRLVDATMTTSERLREYRQALITAAVTGQLDIEAAGRQPIPESDEQLGMFGEAR